MIDGRAVDGGAGSGAVIGVPLWSSEGAAQKQADGAACYPEIISCFAVI